MESLTITRSELSSIRREISALRQMLELSDLVNREKACEILGINSKFFGELIRNGKVNIASTNAAGQKFFSRRELLGIK